MNTEFAKHMPDRRSYKPFTLTCWTMLGTLLVSLLLVLTVPRMAHATNPPTTSAVAASTTFLAHVDAIHTVTWTGAGHDMRWSNPANWAGGRAPTASDIALFDTHATGQAVVDDAFAGSVAGVVLDAGFVGTVRLERALIVHGDVVVAGGQFSGGNALLTIDGHATIQNGIFNTPANVMSVNTLDIQAAAVVRLATNGKLNITGDGAPLTGDGLLDTQTNRPNSVELTGHATGDLTAAGPMKRTGNLIPDGLPNNLRSTQQAIAVATQSTSLSLANDFNFWSAVIDTEHGFAYFGSWTKPGSIVKVRLSTFTRVGAITLNSGEDGLRSAVIDPINGYAYFGTYTAPGKVVKINLNTFTRESALVMPQGDTNLTSAVIDPLKKFAYFGTDTKPGRVIKVNLATFTRVGAIPLETGEDFLQSAVIDNEAAFAYFGTNTTPGVVVKINLRDFTRVNGLKLGQNNELLISAVIDKAAGFAYFGTDTMPGKIIKIDLANFAVDNTLTLNATESSLASAVIDPKNGFAYFGTRTKPGLIVTVKLLDFTRVNAQETSNPNENYLTAAVINPDNGYAYFGTGFDTADTQYIQFNKPGVIIRLGTTTTFTQTGSLQFPGEDKLASAVIDESGGFAYFGTETQPGVVVKIRTSDNTRVAALTLNPDEDNLTSAVIDSKNGYAYFGKGTVETDTIPGLIVKVKLSDFTRVTSLTLNAGENGLRSAVIDVDAGFAYFGTRGVPGRVIKIKLSDFTRVAAVTLNTDEDDLASAVIDTKNGLAYFGTDTQPGIVVRIKLSPFARDTALTLDPGENNLTSAVIDTSGEVSFAYFGTHTSPGIVVKLKLNDFSRDSALQLSGQGFERLISAVINPAADRAYFGTEPLSGNGNGRVIAIKLSDLSPAGIVELNTGEDPLRAAVIDPAAGFAFFGVSSQPGIVVKVQLNPLMRVSKVTLSEAAFNFWSAVIDPTAGFAYFGTWTQPGIVVKVRLADFSQVGTLSLALTEDGLRSAVIDTVNGFAYFGTYTAPGKVVKINLADFTRVGALPLSTGDDNLTSAVIDPAQGQAYFGTDTVPGRVVKVDLATFTRAAGITLNSGENALQSAVIDLLTGNAYFGTFTTPGKVIKIGLASFARVNNLTLSSGEDFLTSAIIDSAKGFAYFGTWTTPARVVKIKLQGLTRDSGNTYSAAQALFTSAVIDPKSGLGYFGTQTLPGRVVKVNLDTLALVDTLVMKNSKEDFLTAAVIDPDNNAAYFGTGFSEADPLYQLFSTPGIVMRIGLNPRADTKKSTATVISATPNPSEVGQSVRFTVTVTGEGNGIPTGSVTFYHHGTIGSGMLNGSGIAIFNTTTIPTETHIITATYDGDSNFVGSTSAPFLHTVNQTNLESSKISIAADINPSASGQQVKFTAIVSPTSGAGGPPTGQVQFYVGGEKMGSPRPLTNGVAATAYNKMVEVRIYTITAKYLGDSKYVGSDANVLSQTITEQVNPESSKITISSNLNPSISGQPVQFTAIVTSTSGAGVLPTGQVQFYIGGEKMGNPQSLTDGVAATTTNKMVDVRIYTITAKYLGDSKYAGSDANVLSQTITSGNTQTKIYLPMVKFGQSVTVLRLSGPAFMTLGEEVSFQAYASSGFEIGNVTFYEGITPFATLPLVQRFHCDDDDACGILTNGALLIAYPFVQGVHNITTRYAGDSSSTAATSNVLTLTVNKTQ